MLRTGDIGMKIAVLRWLLLASVVAGMALTDSRANAADEIARLGEPRRKVVARARTVQVVAQDLASRNADVSGVFPVMIFSSNALVVENVYAAAQPPSACKSIFAAYDSRLRARYGSQIRHGLYCVSIARGQVKAIETVAKSY